MNLTASATAFTLLFVGSATTALSLSTGPSSGSSGNVSIAVGASSLGDGGSVLVQAGRSASAAGSSDRCTSAPKI